MKASEIAEEHRSSIMFAVPPPTPSPPPSEDETENPDWHPYVPDDEDLPKDTDQATEYPTEDSENVGVTPLSMNRYFRSNPYPQVAPDGFTAVGNCFAPVSGTYPESNPYENTENTENTDDPRWKSNSWATEEHRAALAREQQEVRDYLAENPCMTYDEVNAEMLTFAVVNPAVMRWMAEFGDWNYEQCKIMREQILDYGVSKELGQKIYDRGGFTALQANFYIMKNFMCRGCLRFQCTEYMFDGVGADGDRWMA